MAQYFRVPPDLRSRKMPMPKDYGDAVRQIDALKQDMDKLFRHLYETAQNTQPLLERLEQLLQDR